MRHLVFYSIPLETLTHKSVLSASLYPPPSLIQPYHNYKSHCILLQSLLQLPTALFPAHAVVTACFSLSVRLSVSSVSVGYRCDSLLWDKLCPHWSSFSHLPTSPHFLTFASSLSPLFPRLWLPALPNSWSLLHCSAEAMLNQSQDGSMAGVQGCKEDMQQRKMTTQRQENPEEENKRKVKVAD